MPKSSDVPQISFTNWMLGGSLVSHSSISSHRHPHRPERRSSISTTQNDQLHTAKKSKTKSAEQINKKKKERESEMVGIEGFGDLELVFEEASSSSSKPSKTVNKPSNNKANDKTSEKDKDKSDEKPEEMKPDNSLWTPKQDEAVLSMKADNKSWKDIALAVGASKKDVQARWKELSNKDKASPETAGDKDKEKETEKTADKNESKEKSKDVTGGNKDQDRANMEKKDKDECNTTSGRLKADDFWTREDCEMLEMLEARHREQKWMQLQASFYNMTGRMIIAEMIERKFSQG